MKNLIVIGCDGSIGKEIVKHFSKTFNIIGITHAIEIKHKQYFSKLYTEVDVRDISLFDSVCKDIIKNNKRIDGIVYCSGVTIPGSIKDLSIDNWNKSIDINLKGYWLMFKCLYDIIIRSPGCSIVQINSKTGVRASYKNSIYTASKFGGVGLTKSMALEFAEFGVKVNALAPGNVFESKTWNDNKKGLFIEYAKTQNSTPEKIKEKYTNLVPLKRSCHYEDINNYLEFLLSDKSKYITGQVLLLDGGQVI